MKSLNNQNDSVKSVIKWIKFLGWLLWFFLTFPWQISKAYNQFRSAVSFEPGECRTKNDISPSPKYYGNLN
jgi:hypothetical protein